jgi:MFS family permease
MRAISDRRVAGGMWLTFLAGMSFGVVDVLAPLQLSALGAGAVLIGGAFLGSAALETVLSPFVGRLADRRGRLFPVKLSLLAGIAVGVLIPLIHSDWILVAFLVVGLPAYGTLFVPAMAMLSDGADRRKLHHGLGFGLANLSWATGQAIAATSSGALAQATVDAVPYLLLAAAFGCTLLALQSRGRGVIARLGSGARVGTRAPDPARGGDGSGGPYPPEGGIV